MRNRLNLYLLLFSICLVACTKRTDAPSPADSVKVPEVESKSVETPSEAALPQIKYTPFQNSLLEMYCSGLDYKLQQRKVRSATELEHGQRSEIFFLDQKSIAFAASGISYFNF